MLYFLFVVDFSVSRTVGVFWLNVAETWIDIDSGSAKRVIIIIFSFHSSLFHSFTKCLTVVSTVHVL